MYLVVGMLVISILMVVSNIVVIKKTKRKGTLQYNIARFLLALADMVVIVLLVLVLLNLSRMVNDTAVVGSGVPLEDIFDMIFLER